MKVTMVFAAGEQWQHYLSIMDEPLYKKDFKHFNTVNPDAPKGGHLRLSTLGTFNTLNPYTARGIAPTQANNTYRSGFIELNEPLMVGTGSYAPSMEHKNTVYGLIAEAVAYDPEKRKLSFKLRKNARFHDQHAITTEDVEFSYHTLLKQGHPNFKLTLEQVENVKVEDKYIIHFYLKPSSSRALPIKLSELPVLPKHYWQNRDFAKTTLTPPLLSGPYKIARIKPGSTIVYERVTDYWGAELPVNKGLYNFERITLNFYRDKHVSFQAFKNGEIDIHYEGEAKNWETGYAFPAMQQNKIAKLSIPDKMHYGRRFFVFNLRSPMFQDLRVRQAVSMLFDWEWSSKNLFYSAYIRTTSFFTAHANNAPGIPEQEEQELLKPFQSILPSGLYTQPFELSKTRGDGNITRQRREALKLLKEAGWHYHQGQLLNDQNEPFHFTFLHYSKLADRFILPFATNLASVGIKMDFRAIDLSQYQRRIRQRDFDMVQITLAVPFLPGEHLKGLFHSESAESEGSQNLGGIKNPAVDSLVEKALSASNEQALYTAMWALNRVLLWEHYFIPNWQGRFIRIAHWKHVQPPDNFPPFGIRLTSWWMKPTSIPVTIEGVGRRQTSEAPRAYSQ
ncbi:MAG: extracellular solute-binding protein [Endozoicomonas sp.]|uniref:extracellular solute-binding protein n=1 Tax=Endozoicomonas sp. TaxID=1892382 RepID=UPI003D9AD7A1